ncbi:LysR family transcriptional regulator [Variovorax sp. H27-G14]|uniref:LysR family transcriptional regulator n=1 Tax=Variovorax sp. H27-G14 TaxID=3111914 RepID=UPI0038FBEF4A
MSAKKLIDNPRPPEPGGAPRINLRHLQAFSAVAATGSVTQAAEALFRVASAVTRSVAELEAGLGVALFERKARGMLLNAYGEAVRVRANRVEQEFAAACQELAGSDVAALRHAMQVTETIKAIEARSLLASMFSGRRLALFASLSELHNMPAVAAAFGVTQPALSALVRELEARTGRALFTRSARGVTPTRAGSLLAFRCKRALAELRSIESDLAALRGAVEGRVVVGALPLSRTLILPSAIAALVARHPRLHASTVESPYEALAAALRSGDIDFIIGALRPPEDAKDLVQSALFEDRISLIVRAGHPLAKLSRIGRAALQRAQWVLSRTGSPSRELLERAFREAGHPPPVPTVETGDLALLRGLLLRSDMVTAISAHQLHYEIETGALVVLNHPLEGTRRSIGITQRRNALPSPAAQALIDAVRKVVATL